MLTFSACISKSSAFSLAKPSFNSIRYNNRLSMSSVRVTTYNVLSSHLGITEMLIMITHQPTRYDTLLYTDDNNDVISMNI